jgi:uncharacterized protein (TIRG00374 family)
MNLRKLLFLIVRIAVAVCILFYIFINIPFSDVLSVISASSLEFVVSAMIIYSILQIISGYRLKIIAHNQGLSINTFQAVEINLSKMFYGLFLPGGSFAGGTVRFLKLFDKQRNIPMSLAIITLDAFVAIITLCFVGSIMWVIHVPPKTELLLLIILLLLTGCIMMILILFQDKIVLLNKLKTRVLNFRYVPQKIKQIIDTLSEYKNVSLSLLATIITLSIITQLMGITVFYSLAMSLDIDISYVAIGWIRTVVAIAVMLPITISGIGVREGVFIFLLAQYGIGAENSLAFSIVIFVFTVLVPAVVSGILEGRKFLLKPLPNS